MDLALYAGIGCSAKSVASVQNYRSSYLSLMGSVILINGIANGAITTNANVDNLLIPIYCPVYHTSTGSEYVNGLPSLYIAFLSMTSYTSITSLNMIFTQKVDTAKYTSIITSDGQESYRTPNAAKVFTDNNAYFNYLFTLRWADYTSVLTDNDSILYLFYGKLKIIHLFYFLYY
jgi:hypothetical protein